MEEIADIGELRIMRRKCGDHSTSCKRSGEQLVPRSKKKVRISLETQTMDKYHLPRQHFFFNRAGSSEPPLKKWKGKAKGKKKGCCERKMKWEKTRKRHPPVGRKPILNIHYGCTAGQANCPKRKKDICSKGSSP